MQYTISEGLLPVLTAKLGADEAIFTESAGMSWMSSNIEMDTNMRGGLGRTIGRMFSGESLFMTTFHCTEGVGMVNFAIELPGRIIAHELSTQQSIICQRDAFMAGTSDISLEMKLSHNLGAGFLGGEGFVLQELKGPGTAFLEFTGEVFEYDLTEDQTLNVDPGHLAAFEPTVEYDISRVKGVSNMLFSGESLFLAELKGPGKVWLQSMPIVNLGARLSPYIIFPNKKKKKK